MFVFAKQKMLEGWFYCIVINCLHIYFSFNTNTDAMTI